MVKQLQLKLMLLLCALVAGSGTMWADSSYTLGWGAASGSNYTNFTATSGSVTGIVSFSTDKNSASSTPAYNSGSNQLRLYYASNGSGGSITLTPASGIVITGFVMTTVTEPSVKYSVNGGTATSVSASSKTYTVSGISASASLVIQNANTTNTQLQISTIQITYTSAISAPSILPVDGSTITGTQSVTITQAESKDIYYTIDGSTPNSTSTKYTGAFSVSANAITGRVTVKAIAIDGSNSSSVSTVTYKDTSIQPTLISLTTNYEFLGVDKTKNLTEKFSISVDEIGITIDKTSGTWARGDDTYIRIYANNFFKVEAPDGYNVKQVVFTSPGTWGAEPTVGGVAITSKTWTGDAESVQFDFSATNYISAVEITIARALPYVVTFGDLNKTALDKGEEGTFSTTVTPYTGSLVAGIDYEVEWSSSDDTGLAVVEDGTFEATKRGAYKVTATATALDDETYRDATKDYDVTVTEKVAVLADDVVMAMDDDPKAITVVATDGYAGTLTYESNNTDIATVDASGKVTAVAKGTTTITIKSAADASHYFTAGDDVEINVTVKGLAELSYETTLYNVAYGASFPTPTLTNPHDLPITYTKTGDNVATVDASTGAVTILSGTKGTARITASTVGNAEYAAGSAYYDIKVYDPDANDGSLTKPFTVEEANEWIAENLASGVTSDVNYYVRGIVSSLTVNGKGLDPSDDDTYGRQYFFISDDGTETDELGIYYAKCQSNEAFSLTTWVMPGDEVVVCGPLQNYDGDQPYYVETSDNTYVVSVTRRTFADYTLPLEETFASSFGSFTNDGTKVRKNSSSTTYNVWTIDSSNKYAKATSYVTSTNTHAESMLISGMIDGSNAIGLELSFYQAINRFFGTIANEAMVYAREENGSWTKQTISEYPSAPSGNGMSSFEKTTVDLSAFDGKKFQIAFVYKGTTTTAGTWEIKNVSISSASVSVNITASGYLSYCSPYKLDFTDTAVKAYKASVNNTTGKVTLTKVDVVPAEEGVVLFSSEAKAANEAKTYTIPVTTAEASDVTGNEMVGVLTRTQVLWNPSANVYNYILQQGEFNMATDGYLKANRAYLSTSYDVSASDARALQIVFDEESTTTGVADVRSKMADVRSDIYNLNGQKVQNPKKGLYIRNGRKVVIK